MRTRTAPRDGDVVVRLDRPDDLFRVDTTRLLAGPGRLVSGIEELVEEFLGQRKLRARQRIVVELTEQAAPTERIADAMRRYCELRIHDAGRQRAVMWRQGRHSLISGSLLFLAGVILSYWFSRPGAPEFWRELLGDGVFLVVAWVGLWYPLDLLFISRQPLNREIRALTHMKALPVVVRAPTVDAFGGTPPEHSGLG
jgi:hypothetical protein